MWWQRVKKLLKAHESPMSNCLALTCTSAMAVAGARDASKLLLLVVGLMTIVMVLWSAFVNTRNEAMAKSYKRAMDGWSAANQLNEALMTRIEQLSGQAPRAAQSQDRVH